MKQKFTWLTLALSVAWTGWRFTSWRKQRLAELAANGTRVETAVGPIEYTSAGSGPTLLVFHGGPGGYDQIGMMADLVEAGFQVLLPSRPGYLGTPLSAGQTMAAQAEAMIALLNALHIEQVAAIGISAGGPVALEMALRFPQRLWGLVMQSAVTLPYRPNEETADSLLGKLFVNDAGLWLLDIGTWLFEQFSLHFPLLSAHLMIQTESDLTTKQIQDHVNHMRQNPAQIAWYKALIRSIGPMSIRKQGLDNDLVQLANLPQLPLAQISQPTQIIHGQADADVPYSHAQFAAQTIPQAKLITLPEAGHLIWLGSQWAETCDQLAAFLNKQAPIKGSLNKTDETSRT